MASWIDLDLAVKRCERAIERKNKGILKLSQFLDRLQDRLAEIQMRLDAEKDHSGEKQ